MDTSTISFSDDVPTTPHTSSSSHQKQQPEPGPWYTRPISPLTRRIKQNAAGSDSAVSQSSSSEQEQQQQQQLRHSNNHRTGRNSRTSGSRAAKQAMARLANMPVKVGRYEYAETYPGSTLDPGPTPPYDSDAPSTVLIVFIPILVVVLTVLLGVLIFLIALLCMKRQRGIRLTEDGGPLDLSKGDGVIGEGGVEGVEQRWLEDTDEDVREAYRRAKDWQQQYPPASVPTDITLSQFLSIQEKGVAAWAFEPDYEENLSLYVQSRTEITFLSDGPGMPVREGGGNSVMANLPLPKLNEVYYWEVKLYEKAPTTEVAIGLATKPYPSFRLPGWNRFSVAYFASDGFKSHNYPFTASSYGPPLAEGDVLGVGYRPRTGTVFFTRNGRKMEDCYTGLNRLNLFPTVGANGPCTLHVNLGQAGFVFIEANVKKWGLAPMTGTLAPPPAYGSERGSILLDAGYGTPGSSSNQPNLGGIGALLEAARNRAAAQGGSGSAQFARPIAFGSASGAPTPRSTRRSNRRRAANTAGQPSPLRDGNDDEDNRHPAEASSYRSPTDTPQVAPRVPSVDDLGSEDSGDEGEQTVEVDSNTSMQSPPNPPTPNVLDISMHSLRGDQSYFSRRSPNSGSDTSDSGRTARSGESRGSRASGNTLRPPPMEREPSLGPPEDSPPPPGYAPLDPHVYSQGLPADLPEELINQAIAAMSDD